MFSSPFHYSASSAVINKFIPPDFRKDESSDLLLFFEMYDNWINHRKNNEVMLISESWCPSKPIVIIGFDGHPQPDEIIEELLVSVPEGGFFEAFFTYLCKKIQIPNVRPSFKFYIKAKPHTKKIEPPEPHPHTKKIVENSKDPKDMTFESFESQDLSYKDFSGFNFEMASFDGCDLTGAILKDCNFRGASFKGATLKNADMRDSNLLWGDMRGAIVSGLDLRGADLTWTNFEDAQGLDQVDFGGAELVRTNFAGKGEQGVIARAKAIYEANKTSLSTLPFLFKTLSFVYQVIKVIK